MVGTSANTDLKVYCVCCVSSELKRATIFIYIYIYICIYIYIYIHTHTHTHIYKIISDTPRAKPTQVVACP